MAARDRLARLRGMRSWHRPPDTAPTRQVVAAALTLLVLGGVGAVQAGLAGASFMFDLEQVEPALAHHAPPVQLDSLMDRARAAGLRVATATDYDVLPRLFLRRQGHGPPPAPAEIDLLAAGAARAAGAPQDPGVEAAPDLDSLEQPAALPGIRAPDADLASPFDDARY